MPQYDNVYVRNLPMGVTQDVIKQIFGCYGEVSSCRVMTKEGLDSATALVKFADSNCAQESINALHGGIPELLQKDMDPNVGLVCKYAISDEEKKKGGEGAKGGGKGMQDQRYQPYGQPQQAYGGGKGAKGAAGAGGEMRFKTVMCKHFLSGTCTKGPGCSFAHGEHELSSGKGGAGAAYGRRAGAPQQAYNPAGYAAPPPDGKGARGAYAKPAAPTSTRLSGTEQIEYLKSFNHPLLGSLRSAIEKGEPDTLLTISEIPAWMDESGLYLLFSPYGAVNTCQLEASGVTAKIRYVHQLAATNAVGHLNGLRLDANTKPLGVMHTPAGM